MAKEPPKIIEDEMYMFLREGKFEEFNSQKEGKSNLEFIGCDFRGIDLRKFDLNGVNLADSYFRGTDLRGVDLRNTEIEGASLARAKISGCFFSNEFAPAEIELSVKYGTRLRKGSR